MKDRRKDPIVKTVVEKYLPMFIGALLIALMSWVGNSVIRGQESVVELQNETRNLRLVMDDLKEEIRDQRRDRYTRSDATRDWDFMASRFASLQKRVDALEKATAK